MIQENLASMSWFLPELGLTAGIMLMFLLDLAWKKHPRRVLFLTVGTLLVPGLGRVLLAMQPSAPRALFNGMIASDPFATFFKWLFLAAAALTVLIAARSTEFGRNQIGVFYPLLLSIVLGMFLMASAVDLLMMYLAVELVSLVSYALAGYRQGDRKAAEAALKYVIYGGVASGIMLFGMSYIYGLTGSTSLLGLGACARRRGPGGAMGSSQTALRVALAVAVIFVLSGVGYKIASVPWHMWCPDVYEGAPTPFTAFLSVGPKAAGFALAVRFFWSALAGAPSGEGPAVLTVGLSDLPWPAIIGVLAAVTMTLGNLTAIVQNNLKRLLAYSSIAHAGYALDGPLRGLDPGHAKRDDLFAGVPGDEPGRLPGGHRGGAGHRLGIHRRLQGAGRRHPLSAIAFAICLFSLTGLPPFAGFTGKWYLFVAVLQNYSLPGGGWYAALAVIGALNSAVSLYYYMRIVRAMFLDAPVGEVTVRPHLGYQIMLGAFSVALLLFGVWWNPLWRGASSHWSSCVDSTPLGCVRQAGP
jgi:NADH-quinone oxidoreductase subunit N